MRPEAVLMKRIRVALAKDGRARVVPNFVGSMVPSANRDSHPVTVGLGIGSADLVGMLRSGRVFALEIKTPTGKVSAEQARWLVAVRAWGGFAAVVRSPEEAIAAVERAVRGESQ